MYLHLGKSVVVTRSSIVGVFDLDNSSYSYLTREYLTRAEKSGNVINVSDDLPKSFVLCQEGDGQKVYLSQLAASTLLKREDSFSFAKETRQR